MNTTTIPQQTTTRQWLAQLCAQLSQWLNGDTLPLTLAQMHRDELRAAEVGLMQAEAEAERYNHSVKMLTARIARLKARVG